MTYSPVASSRTQSKHAKIFTWKLFFHTKNFSRQSNLCIVLSGCRDLILILYIAHWFRLEPFRSENKKSQSCSYWPNFGSFHVFCSWFIQKYNLVYSHRNTQIDAVSLQIQMKIAIFAKRHISINKAFDKLPPRPKKSQLVAVHFTFPQSSTWWANHWCNLFEILQPKFLLGKRRF